LNIEVYHNFWNFRIHMHFKLCITLCLVYYCKIRSYISNVCSKCIYLYSLHKCMKRSHVNKIKEIEINMQIDDISWNIMILQKIRKKNQWIWIYYDRETLVSNFNRRLKRKTTGKTGSVCATWSQWSNSTNLVVPCGPEDPSLGIWNKLL
jgi:hypothetical protein